MLITERLREISICYCVSACVTLITLHVTQTIALYTTQLFQQYRFTFDLSKPPYFCITFILCFNDAHATIMLEVYKEGVELACRKILNYVFSM